MFASPSFPAWPAAEYEVVVFSKSCRAWLVPRWPLNAQALLLVSALRTDVVAVAAVNCAEEDDSDALRLETLGRGLSVNQRLAGVESEPRGAEVLRDLKVNGACRNRERTAQSGHTCLVLNALPQVNVKAAIITILWLVSDEMVVLTFGEFRVGLGVRLVDGERLVLIAALRTL